MHIIMLQTLYGSEDGFCVRLFQQNQEYEIADTLAAYFVRIGAACHPHAGGDLERKYLSVPVSLDPASSAG